MTAKKAGTHERVIMQSRLGVGTLEYKWSDIILDIGCGGGATLKRMSDSVVSGHLTGVDYSSTSVEMSKETNYDSVKSGKTDIIEASVEHLPFLDNSFDKIITVESFYFWPHPQENLKEVYRVLKTDGTFLLVADIYGKDGLDVQILENIKKFNLYNPTPDEYKKLFENAGFIDVKVHIKEDDNWICIEGHK